MTAPLSRRAVLTASVSVLGIDLAGCNQSATSGTPEPSTSEDTPEPEPSPSQTRPSTEPETEAATPTPTPGFEIPTPKGECEPVDLPAAEYPSLPIPVKTAPTSEFALEFEKTHVRAQIEADTHSSFSDFGSDVIYVAKRWSHGILVHVGVEAYFTADTDGTVTASGISPSSGWYYVTREFAMRAPARDKRFREMPTRGWETVACRDG